MAMYGSVTQCNEYPGYPGYPGYLGFRSPVGPSSHLEEVSHAIIKYSGAGKLLKLGAGDEDDFLDI